MVNSVALQHGDRWKYVDDITVGAYGKPTETTNPVLQDTMLAINADAIRDMSINAAKCSTMRIAASNRPGFKPLLLKGGEIPHTNTMKLLGIIIQHSLKWDSHVEAVVMKANNRRYFITVLKRAGVKLEDLTRCYCTFIRPVLEYAAPVWHGGLTGQQSDLLEQVQRQCLRTLPPYASHREALQATGLQTLVEHRSQVCMNFAQSLLSSQEFACWLPK